MAESRVFDLVCEGLEQETSLERPAARGTVRLALKEAGLSPDTVTPEQMAVVTERVLPAELEALRVEDVPRVCGSLRDALGRLDEGDAADASTPEAVFGRLGRV